MEAPIIEPEPDDPTPAAAPSERPPEPEPTLTVIEPDDAVLPAPPPVEVFPFEGDETTPDREILNALHRLGATISERFEAFENLWRREGRAEAAREKVIDRLHAELQEYKQDLLLNTLRPVFVDLIQLHDDIGKVAVAPVEPQGDDVARLVGLLAGFQQGIEDILYRQGVEPFQVEGDSFDPRRQRAVATVTTDDPGTNKTVAARIRKGFQAGDRVIRPEVVSVYAFKKSS